MQKECNATKKDMEIALLKHENNLLMMLEKKEKERNKEYSIRKKEMDKRLDDIMNEVQNHPKDYQRIITNSVNTLSSYIDTQITSIKTMIKEEYVTKIEYENKIKIVDQHITTQKRIAFGVGAVILGEFIRLMFLVAPKLINLL